jgi:hypothetical protein
MPLPGGTPAPSTPAHASIGCLAIGAGQHNTSKFLGLGQGAFPTAPATEPESFLEAGQRQSAFRSLGPSAVPDYFYESIEMMDSPFPPSSLRCPGQISSSTPCCCCGSGEPVRPRIYHYLKHSPFFSC